MNHILIVEDEHILALLLADLLEDHGYDVALSDNGAAALAAVHADPPALIITDFIMPELTGLELAQALRADASHADIPIILVSGAHCALAEQSPDLFHAMFDKPYCQQQLLSEVAQLVKPSACSTS